MGDKMYKVVIKVDLSCCCCRKAIQDYLCRMQRKVCMQIVSIEYDEKKDVVLVSCPFNPQQLKRKLLCKLPKIIKDIEIKEPKPVGETKPSDPRKEVFMKKCEEEYKEIRKRMEKCKKECEEKCMKECEDPFKCKCNRQCECDGKGEQPTQPQPQLTQPQPTQPQPNQPPTLPMYPWPPKLTIICCARPCPCWTAWSNNYRCCSCGMESWPGRSRPGWGSGPSYGGTPQWSNCEPSRPTNITLESTEPPCSIM